MSTPHLLAVAGMVAPSILQPLRPTRDPERWTQCPLDFDTPPSVIAMERWLHRAGFHVLTAIECIKEGDEPERLDYHISISRLGRKRASSAEALHVLKSFPEEGWEEDNHVPGGFVRNYWRPVVDNNVGRECPCKDSEPAIREDKGDYVWREAP